MYEKLQSLKKNINHMDLDSNAIDERHSAGNVLIDDERLSIGNESIDDEHHSVRDESTLHNRAEIVENSMSDTEISVLTSLQTVQSIESEMLASIDENSCKASVRDRLDVVAKNTSEIPNQSISVIFIRD